MLPVAHQLQLATLQRLQVLLAPLHQAPQVLLLHLAAALAARLQASFPLDLFSHLHTDIPFSNMGSVKDEESRLRLADSFFFQCLGSLVLVEWDLEYSCRVRNYGCLHVCMLRHLLWTLDSSQTVD